MAITAESLSIAYFSNNPIWLVCTSDQLGVVTNLRIKCLVQLQNQQDVYRTASVYESVNAEGAFVFNLGELIYGMTRDWFDVPAFDVTSKICTTTPIRAEIYLTEVYNGETGDSATDVTYIVNGGVRLEQLDVPNDWWTVFEIYADGDFTKIPFLTNKPLISTWKPKQPEFLYYYNHYEHNADFDLGIEYFDQYGNSLAIAYHTRAGVPNNRIAMWNVGKIMQDRFAVGPDDRYYRIWMESDGEVVSHERFYYIDKEYYPNVRWLAFENKKGGFDTVALAGDDSVGGTIDGAFVGKEYLRGQHTGDGVRTVTKRKIERKIKKNSGWLTKLERNWLIELLESKQVYEVTGYNEGAYADAVLLPIVLDTKDLPAVNSAEFLNGFLLEWTYGN